MRNYYFYILKKNHAYFFLLYPNNSNLIEIGKSNPFPTENEAKEALYQFRQFIKDNSNTLHKYLEITKEDNYSYGFIKYNFGTFHRRLGYCKKSEYKKWLQRIVTNIDAPLENK